MVIEERSLESRIDRDVLEMGPPLARDQQDPGPDGEDGARHTAATGDVDARGQAAEDRQPVRTAKHDTQTTQQRDRGDDRERDRDRKLHLGVLASAVLVELQALFLLLLRVV